MTLTSKMTTLGLIAALAGASLAPAMANEQRDKNNARNLALGGAAVALYGILNHNSTATLLGAAGAAIGGSQYEKDRQDQSYGSRRYYRDYRGGYSNGYDRNGYDNNGWNRDGYNRDGYNRDGFNRDGYNRNGFDRDGHDRNYQNQYRDNQNQNNWRQDDSNQNNRGDRY